MNLFSSTIAKKFVVALTGLVLFGFVVGHLLGNLQIFLGPDVFNAYAEKIKSLPPLLWGTRIVLVASVILHIVTTISLVRLNRKSRPISYEVKKDIQASAASKTMIYGGLFLAAYIVFHLLHLTVGSVHPDFNHDDIYRNVVIGFSSIPVSIFYIFGIMALGMHLYHGAWSIFQTLGFNHPQYNAWRRCFATAAALFITVGYISIPIGVLFGVIR